VKSQTCGRNQQRHERDEKDNQKPTHETNFPKDTRERRIGTVVFRLA
jgi:hypothetical protein